MVARARAASWIMSMRVGLARARRSLSKSEAERQAGQLHPDVGLLARGVEIGSGAGDAARERAEPIGIVSTDPFRETAEGRLDLWRDHPFFAVLREQCGASARIEGVG